MVDWTTGLLMTMAMRQREADHHEDQRAFEDRLAADDREWAAGVEAQQRHEEMIDALVEARRDRELDKEEAARAKQAREDAAPWFGPRLEAGSLGLTDLSERPLPSDLDALLSMLQPPNLLVTGGTVDDGWAAAQTISDLLGASLVGLDLRAVTRFSLTGDSKVYDILFAERADWAVVLLASLDRPSQHGAWWVAAALDEDRAEDALPDRRQLPLMVGVGASARALMLTSPRPFILVGHSESGWLPATLRAWGGWLPRPKPTKTCPQCAEEVKAAARICRFCRYEFGS